MNIYILGICGTFMGGVALIARQLGLSVSGCDAAVYPPMSDTLREAGITIHEGYDPAQLTFKPDLIVIGNAMTRGNPMLEYVLNQGWAYVSGPQWLADVALKERHVLAIAGTHGKTTTSSLLTWILETNGRSPGFLIGGVPCNFSTTARMGESPYFVIEADEYDTAFFDKRSKFMHYHPRTLVVNNLEYDHADIFPDLAAIQRQFELLLRTVPSKGCIIRPYVSEALDVVFARVGWTPVETTGEDASADWQLQDSVPDGSRFTFSYQQHSYTVSWTQIGLHNVANALAAIAAASQVGISVPEAINAVETFQGVKRRMEVRGTHNGVTVYDDFAHHPTAIQSSLQGLRARVGETRIVAILQFASNTMREGVHQSELAQALDAADDIIFLHPNSARWNIQDLMEQCKGRAQVCQDVEAILQAVVPTLKTPTHVLIMSNKGFDGLHQKLLDQLS